MAVAIGLIAAIAAPGAGASGYVAADEGLLTMSSEPGDYVGGGRSYSYSAPADSFRSHKDGTVIDIRVNALNGEWWYLTFTAPRGELLAPGTYAGATRAAFRANGVAGLDVSGNGRGCNTLTGGFTVLDVRYGPDNYLQSFHATFEQHCEGFAPALRGEVRVVNPAELPPPLQVSLVLDPAGEIEYPGGRAVIHGTITCSRPARGVVAGSVLQQVGRQDQHSGSFFLSLDCSEQPTAWSATLPSDFDRIFLPGTAQALVEAAGYDPRFDEWATESRNAPVELSAGP